MKCRASSFSGEPSCGFEVKIMSSKKAKKSTNKKQRRTFLPWIDKIAAAAYWVVKIILLLVDYFNR